MAKAKKEKVKKAQVKLEPPQSRPNFWGMIQTLGIAAMNRGQLLWILVFVPIVILVSKLSEADASKLMEKLLDHFTIFHLGGWILSLVLLLGWFFSSRRQRKKFSTQLGELQSDLQQINSFIKEREQKN